MSAADWAKRATEDAQRYRHENPTWADKDATAIAAAGGSWESRATPEQLAWAAYLKTETREQFWERHIANGCTLQPHPPLKPKRGPSKIVLQLQARVRELESELAAARGEVAA